MVVTPNKQDNDRTIPYLGPVRRPENKCTALKKALGMADISKLDKSSSESDSGDSVVTVIENPSTTPSKNSTEPKGYKLLMKPKANPNVTMARIPGLIRETMNNQSKNEGKLPCCRILVIYL